MQLTGQDGTLYRLSNSAPGILSGDGISGTETLPWALYSLESSVSGSALLHLAKNIEQGFVIEVSGNEHIHLIRPAPTSSCQQPSLESALETHIQYGVENSAKLEYYPYGFLLAHDRDWLAQGLWLVYVDFEGDKPVTAFQLKVADVGGVCWTLREDDDSAIQLEKQYKINK